GASASSFPGANPPTSGHSGGTSPTASTASKSQGSTQNTDSGNASSGGGVNSSSGLARLEQLFRGPSDKTKNIAAPPSTSRERQSAGENIVAADSGLAAETQSTQKQTKRNASATPTL